MAINYTEYGRGASIPSPTTSSFRSIRGLGFVVVAGAAVATGLRAVELLLTWELVERFGDWERDTVDASAYLANLEEATQSISGVAWTSVLVQLLASVLFVVWVYRARANAELLCSAQHRLPRVWAIVGFLPLVNWVVPPILVDDIQRASHPATPRNAVRLFPSPMTWIVVAWWLSFVLGACALFVAYLLSIGVRYGFAPSSGPARAGLLVQSASLVLWTTAVVLLAVLLARVGRWQADRADGIGAEPMEQPSAPSSRPAVQAAPNGGLGMVTAVLSGTVVIGPALIAIAAPKYQAVRDAPDGSAAQEAAVDAWAPLTLLGIAVWAFTLFLAGVSFLAWLWRARLTAERMAPGGHLLKRGWTIGGWFVPLANLILPALVVGDVHRASRTPAHAGGATASYSLLVAGWWLSWLTTWIWTWLALLLLQPVFWWGTTAFFALTAALLVMIIRQVDRGQRPASFPNGDATLGN
ncbi:DUF4328 domain-containing protein [Nocardia sp. NPDC049149]|uniref:DUF4328 domain-containing protein n=1 Tax=Nocardia sp. NPDC049149 TaxID=3364315 RepID=UPI00371AE0B7